MDDIQFWLYLLFVAIYIISRALKKKDPQKNTNKPSRPQNPQRPQRKPVSFEELLKEFTEEKEAEPHQQEPYSQKEEEEVEYQTIEGLDEQEQAQPFEEGRTRRFSDEESRRVYEESIARAKGAEIQFERDDHFKSKLERKEEGEENSVASEIKEALSNPEDARKAVVLSEILNRKY